jgi:4-hydroxybenzoate polyprenyltransferase
MPDYAEQTVEERLLPLVVDLDGTLVKTDMLYESYLSSVPLGFTHHLACFRALSAGKATLKRYLAQAGDLDYANLPYDEAVLEVIRAARAEGRPVYLATASDRVHAAAIAAHLGLFNGIFASDGATNLSSSAKARVLVETFGRGGFDYIGNGHADLAVWAEARKAYAIRTTARVARALDRIGVPVERLHDLRATARTWIKAVRVHQYAKNTLIFVPMLTAHAYALATFMQAALAFVAFSLCASGVYLINDLMDLEADRRHPTKQFRPLPSGAIPIVQALVAAPVLLAVAALCAASVSLHFFSVLLGYFVLTTAYSLYLKRKMMIDAVVLAMLYTVRVVAGAAAIDVYLSEWLLAFSMFIFFSLALIKRYVELTVRIDLGLADPSNRNYKLGDTTVVAALAAASGLNAVTIFSLFIASPTVQASYRRPELLWLMCPVMMYWIARTLLMAHRRMVTDDPLVFALRDKSSRYCIVLMAAIVLLAT